MCRDCRAVLSAGNEDHVLSGLRQAPTEVAAHAASPKYRDFHASPWTKRPEGLGEPIVFCEETFGTVIAVFSFYKLQ
jgi:hypothetical protein